MTRFDRVVFGFATAEHRSPLRIRASRACVACRSMPYCQHIGGKGMPRR